MPLPAEAMVDGAFSLRRLVSVRWVGGTWMPIPVLAVTTALLTRPEPLEKRRGLVSGEPAGEVAALIGVS